MEHRVGQAHLANRYVQPRLPHRIKHFLCYLMSLSVFSLCNLLWLVNKNTQKTKKIHARYMKLYHSDRWVLLRFCYFAQGPEGISQGGTITWRLLVMLAGASGLRNWFADWLSSSLMYSFTLKVAASISPVSSVLGILDGSPTSSRNQKINIQPVSQSKET